MSFLPYYDPFTGKLDGVKRGALSIAKNGRGWSEFLAWNAEQAEPISLDDISPTARIPRTLIAIRTDLDALTGPQKLAIWNDLSSGTPKKIYLDSGPNAAALMVLDLIASSVTLPAADMNEAKLRAATMYVQDNPTYLVNPSFDPTIDVPGDEIPT